MREILFRGKRTDNGKWVFGNLIIYKDGDDALSVIQELTQSPVHDPDVEVCPNSLEELMEMLRTDFKRYVVTPETVGQFTGLHDKNGNKVFGGDVLEIERQSDSFGTYFDPPLKYPAKVVVRWDMCSWLWEVCGQEKYYLHFPDAWCQFKCQVVGNIHDNPELLDTKPES